MGITDSTPVDLRLSERRRNFILLLGGANFMLLQFIVVRTFPALLLEGIIFVVLLTYFMGCSAGYFLSDRIGNRGLRRYAGLQWITQLTMPFSIRWIAGTMAALNWNRSAMIVMLFLGTFWTCSFYAILLPLFLSDRKASGESDFVRCYRWEIAGALLGLIFVSAGASFGARYILSIYEGILALVLCLLIRERWAYVAGAAAWAGYCLFFPQLSLASMAYLYKKASGIDVRSILVERETPYQRIELLQGERSRYLFLDGFGHYVSDMGLFNYFVAGLPASLLRSPEAAVVGSGSFGAAQDVLPLARSVTSVEVDPAVAEAGLKWLAKPFPPEEQRKWSLVIDDALHFFASTDRRFDLIALDIAGPFQRQVARLYSVEALRILRSRLKPGGVLGLATFGDYEQRTPQTMALVQGLAIVFDDVFVVTDADRSRPALKSFAMAGDHLGFTKADIEKRLREKGLSNFHIYDRADIDPTLREGYQAFSVRHMGLTLWISFARSAQGIFYFKPSEKI